MKMIIKNYSSKYLAKASNNKLFALYTTKSKHHDQLHLLFTSNIKYRRNIDYQLHHHHHHHHNRQHLHNLRYVLNSSYYLFVAVLCVISLCCVDAVGYSYTRFIGPVAGPEHRIYVNHDAPSATNDASSRLDYVAKPEYDFAYGVEDADAHILHNRNEVRDGDAVKGVYSVVDPDGTLRVVKYTADDDNGFQAEVITNGVSTLHGQKHQENGNPSKITNGYYNNNQFYKQQYQPPKLKEGVYPPISSYTPNLEQQINQYYPQNQYQAPPSIIYHINNNDDDDDNYDNNDNDDYQPQYEVHEKPNKDDDEDGDGDDNDDNDHENDNGGGDGGVDGGGGGNKKKKGNHKDDDNDSDDDYDDSEELEDYDEAVHSNEVSEESGEYY